MQPTPTTATAAGAATTVALTSRWDNATGSPTAEPDPILDNYVLLVVVMSLFVGGALVVLSGVLLLCRRCWEAHRRFNRCAARPPQRPPRAPARLEPGDRARACVSLCGVGGLLLSAWGARCVHWGLAQ